MDEVDDLRERIAELEQQNSALLDEVETYRNESITSEQDKKKVSQELEKQLESIKKENEQLKLNLMKQEVLKNYPFLDPSLIVGNSKEELEESAKRLATLYEKGKEEGKNLIQNELKKKWETAPSGNPATPNPSEKEPEHIKLLRETWEKTRNQEDYIKYVMAQQGILKKIER